MTNRADEIRAFLASSMRGKSNGGASAAAVVSIAGSAAPAANADVPAGWGCAQIAGRLVELSGVGAVASLTAAIGLVLDAQRRGDPVAWVTLPTSSFYPPDVAESGVDLDALIVVRVPLPAKAKPGAGRERERGRGRGRGLSGVPDERAVLRAIACDAAARAADRLVRSGGFGLIVLDLGKDAEISTGLQGRLAGLAQRHDAAIVCLTEKPSEAASLGSMVSLRAESLRRLGDECTCQVRVLKDKRRAPSWTHAEVVRAPAGLR